MGVCVISSVQYYFYPFNNVTDNNKDEYITFVNSLSVENVELFKQHYFLLKRLESLENDDIILLDDFDDVITTRLFKIDHKMLFVEPQINGTCTFHSSFIFLTYFLIKNGISAKSRITYFKNLLFSSDSDLQLPYDYNYIHNKMEFPTISHSNYKILFNNKILDVFNFLSSIFKVKNEFMNQILLFFVEYGDFTLDNVTEIFFSKIPTSYDNNYLPLKKVDLLDMD